MAINRWAVPGAGAMPDAKPRRWTPAFDPRAGMGFPRASDPYGAATAAAYPQGRSAFERSEYAPPEILDPTDRLRLGRGGYEERLGEMIAKPGIDERTVEQIISRGTEESAEGEAEARQRLGEEAAAMGFGRSGAAQAGQAALATGYAGQRANLARDARIEAEKQRRAELGQTMGTATDYLSRYFGDRAQDEGAGAGAAGGAAGMGARMPAAPRGMGGIGQGDPRAIGGGTGLWTQQESMKGGQRSFLPKGGGDPEMEIKEKARPAAAWRRPKQDWRMAFGGRGGVGA